jgi:hypothetical protein
VTTHPGIVLAMVATVVYNLGFIVEKRALGRLPALEAHHVPRLARTLFTAPAWLAGFLLICGGLVLQLLVLSLEPLTVAQPLQVSGVVVTILFSRLLLHERLGRAELACIGVIAVAAKPRCSACPADTDRVRKRAPAPPEPPSPRPRFPPAWRSRSSTARAAAGTGLPACAKAAAPG